MHWALSGGPEWSELRPTVSGCNHLDEVRAPGLGTGRGEEERQGECVASLAPALTGREPRQLRLIGGRAQALLLTQPLRIARRAADTLTPFHSTALCDRYPASCFRYDRAEVQEADLSKIRAGCPMLTQSCSPHCRPAVGCKRDHAEQA